MKIIVAVFVLILAFVIARKSMAQESPVAGSVHDFTVTGIDGKEVKLSDYQGKVLLIVNTASRCGFTGQYKGLEALYQQYKDQGLVVLGFPANNFLGQEPGTDKEIKQFCELKYKTTFPLFSKISVRGQDMAPLYSFLTQQSGFNGPVTWNFNKFLVGKDGKVIARFDSRVEPLAQEIVSQIQEALKKP